MQQTLISFFCFVFLSFSSKVLGENQNTCRELKCGKHGPAIRFPYSLKGSHPENCGYPGFLVSCNEKQETILELPISVKFPIKTIDYKNQQIQIHDPENCLLVKLLKVHYMSISPFQYSKNQLTDINLFNYSSATETESTYNIDPVPCMSGPGYLIYSSYSRWHDPQNLYLEWGEPYCGLLWEAYGNKCGLKNNGTKSTEIECLHRKGGSQKKLVATVASLGSYCWNLWDSSPTWKKF